MSSFSMDTRSLSSSPLVNSLVKNRLFKTTPEIDEPPFQFIHTMNLSVVDTMLHNSPNFAIHRTEIRAVRRPQLGRKKVWRFLTQQFKCCTCVARCAGALSRWNIVVTRHSAYRRQQYGIIVTSWSSIEEVSKTKRYHQNFLLCNNNEITAFVADLFNSFCEEVYTVAFFKVVQQQTIGKVENSITCLWADNFCLQWWKIIKIAQFLRQLCSNEKWSRFFWLTVYY